MRSILEMSYLDFLRSFGIFVRGFCLAVILVFLSIVSDLGRAVWWVISFVFFELV